MALTEKQKREGRRTIATEIVQLKHRLGELELWETMQAMEAVTQQIGWELAGGDRNNEKQYRRSVGK